MNFYSQNSLAIPASVLGENPRKQQAANCSTKNKPRIFEIMGQLGSRPEFERLVKSHLDPAMRLAIRLTNNDHQAEEVVQETMLRATRNWESFRKQAQFKTWLYRILINVYRDQQRKRKLTTTEIKPDQCRSKLASAESKAQANELTQMVACLVAQLPARQREVLVLATYESMSTEQIANALDITAANVYSNLNLARKQLKSQLEKYI